MAASKKNLKVLMMVSWYGPKGDAPTGGIFHYEQSVELNKYCDCAIYYPYDQNIEEDVEYGDDWGILTFRSKYKLENKIRNRINMIKAMITINKVFKPDIIHGNVATEAGRFAVMLGKMFNIPVIISEHSSADYSGVTTFPHNMYANNVYKNSKYNACVSDYLTKRLKEIFPKYEFHTVYNGINVDYVAEEKTHSYKREGYINIGCVAGFYDRNIKGIQYLIPAIARLVKEGKNVFLHIVGGGDYLDEYKQMASDLDVSDNICFYGHCNKDMVYQIVSEVDFSVSASLVESFGCSIAEAVMLGKPVVGTRCGGLESIIDDKTGILADVGSEDSLYDAIKEMCEKYMCYDSQELTDYAKDKFSMEKITKKYLEIYESVLSN